VQQGTGNPCRVERHDAPVTRSEMTRNNQVMSRCGRTGRVDYTSPSLGPSRPTHQSEQ
jgi:hypothetical protein